MADHTNAYLPAGLAPMSRRLTRRGFLKTAAVATASTGALSLLPGCAGTIPTAASRKTRPNIIFILADDLGYGDLACYGQKTIRTPNIDRLAAEGMLFTDHYAGSTVCAPSRCCLMTGLHTGHALIRGNARDPLRPSDVTVARLLKQAGYATALVGKWGLGEADSTGIPTRQGFDYFFGYLNQRHAHNYYPEFLWRNDQKVAIEGNKLPSPEPGGWGRSVDRATYSHDLFTQEALAFLRRTTGGPFFLYLAYTIPHANNEAAREGMEVPSLEPYAAMDWPQPQKGHAAMITRMDGDIGRLMAALKELHLDERTLVLFSSDNGPHKEGGADPAFFKSSGPLRGYKRDLYEGGIRVPLLARWPAVIKAASVSPHVSAFSDFLPTCCDLAAVKPPDGIDGISMVPTLLADEAARRQHEYLYWEFHEQGKKQAVRFGPWKALRLNLAKNPNAPIELYDLANDLAETTNVAPDHPDLVEQALAYMKSARTPSDAWPLPA